MDHLTTIIAALIGATATIIAAWIVVRASQSPRAENNRSSLQGSRPTGPTDSSKPGTPPPSIPNPGVTNFWRQYWLCVQKEFPALSIKQPGKVPAGSDWPQFRNTELGVGRRIVHKWGEGFVDLEIQGAAQAVDELRARNQAVLPPDVEVVQTSKSASFRLTVPKIDRFGDFSKQLAAVRAGLAAAARLLTLAPQIKS